MTAYSHPFRQAADASRRAAEWTRWVCAVVGVSSGPHWLYAAAFFEMLARISGEMASDPPRPDFETATRVRNRFAEPQHIATEDLLGSTAIRTAVAVDEAERYLGAHLRAFERLQEALRRGGSSVVAERRGEAIEYAREGSAALGEVAASLEELIPLLPRDWPEQLGPEQQERVARLTPPEIEPDTLALLFLGGLRVRDLQNALVPIAQLPESGSAQGELMSAPGAFRDLGDRLSRWSPPSAR